MIKRDLGSPNDYLSESIDLSVEENRKKLVKMQEKLDLVSK